MPQDAYIFPVSFAQQRLWFLDRIAPGNPFYNIPLAVPVRTSLDVGALERALNAMVERHESLRTTFHVVDGQPHQVVHPRLDVRVTVTDLRNLPNAERDARTMDLATEDARRPFDLEAGPLIRCGLVVRGPFDHVLLLSMHHIIADGWSMGILARELTALYQASVSGYPARLPELPIQYADFAVWQRETPQGRATHESLDYWRAHLEGLPTLDIPTDRPRPPVLTYAGASHPVSLSPSVSARVRQFAQATNTTPFMVLLAAFSALLHRYSGQDDIVIGTPVANRDRAELEGLIGFFVNSLVIRVDVGGTPSFYELVARVREVALGAYAHQDLPFEKLVEELQPPRDGSRNPLFQVTFQLVNTPTMQYGTAGGQGAAVVEVQRGSAIFDIAFTLIDSPTGFSGIFEYSTDLFDPPTIERLERHFTHLLDGALARPERRISEWPLMNEAETAAVLTLCRGTRLDMAGRGFIHRSIATQAAHAPDAPAVQSESGTLSYQELINRSRRLAHYLIGLGVRPESRVGIFMDRSAAMVTAMLAILDAGGAYVPLDPTYPPDRLRHMLADSAATVILTDTRCQEMARALTDAETALVSVDADADVIRTCSDAAVDVDLMADNLAYILYTSGSTGRPKGVAIPHAALANHMAWMLTDLPLTASDRVLQRTPQSFDASVWEFFAPLMAGASLVVLPPEAQKNPELIVRCMARRRVTVAQFVPTLLRMVIDEPEFYACVDLRRICCGGEAFTDDIRSAIRTSLGAEVVNLYGPTEATIDSTFYTCGDEKEPFGVPIGAPVSNAQAYVLDALLEHVPAGVAGELYIAGNCLARGYLNQPGLTAERFLPDPFSGVPGLRMYRTGDRVRRLNDGRLLFLGRVDEQVKIRGYRIELGEVESAIRRVEGVKDCAVVAEATSGTASTLLAYVSASWDQALARRQDEPTAAQREHLARWEGVYEEIYSELPTKDDDFTGWHSSYTGLPIEAAEMREWRAATLASIRALKPTRVLEIGCGTGLLLTQLASQCERYVGTDFSRPVLQHLPSKLGPVQDACKIDLLHRTAENLDGLADASFDTVILNSVVQYFPDLEYLFQVLTRAARTVAPGGRIFVGDVRSLPLLEAFHLSLALSKGGPPDLEDLAHRLQSAAQEEEELVVDPRFFYSLPRAISGIAAAEVSLKRGRYANELSRFRYDVVLRVGTDAPEPASHRLDWQRQEVTLHQCLSWVDEQQPDTLIIENVLNARVAEASVLADKLTTGEWHGRSLDQLRREVERETAGALHPEDFWQAPELRPWDVRICFSAHPAAERFDVVLGRPGCPAVADPALEHMGEQRAEDSRWATDPLRGAITRQLVGRIRERLATQLPDYMVPSAFVLLDEIPLLPNGKLNRKAVPARRVTRYDENSYIAPRTIVERAIAMIWAEVLQIDRVGIRNDFFTDLGGHSLLATQLISQVRAAFSIEVPLKLVFQASTIERFAAALVEGDREHRETIEAAASLFVRLSSMSETELDAALQSGQSIPA